MTKPMDKLHIRDLTLSCIIGTRPPERKKKQKVIIQITLEGSMAKAMRSDRLEDAINYKTLTDEVTRRVEDSRFFLIERLADRIAAICLKTKDVKAVTVVVDKPQALKQAQSAAIEIYRTHRA